MATSCRILSGITLALIALMLGAMTGLSAEEPGVASAPGLKYSSVPLPVDFHGVSIRGSLEPGIIVINGYKLPLPSPDLINGYKLEAGGLIPRFSMPFDRELYGVFRQWLGGGKVLTTRGPRSAGNDLSDYAAVDPQDYKLYICDISTGDKKDLEISNLTSTPAWPTHILPPTWWCEQYGLSLFIYNHPARTLELWQGQHELQLVQTIDKAIDYGNASKDGTRSYIVFSEDRTAALFSETTGRLEPAPEYAALAASITACKPTAKHYAPNQYENPKEPSGPRAGVFCQELAVWKVTDGLEFITASGQLVFKATWDCIANRPDGTPRDATDLITAEDESWTPDLYYVEGQTQPADVITFASGPFPIDEHHIGLLDGAYNRIVLVSVK